MPKKRHKPEEIVARLRQVDVLVAQGQSLADAVRSIGVTEVTYYRWRQEYGDLKTDQVRRIVPRHAVTSSILVFRCGLPDHRSPISLDFERVRGRAQRRAWLSSASAHPGLRATCFDSSADRASLGGRGKGAPTEPMKRKCPDSISNPAYDVGKIVFAAHSATCRWLRRPLPVEM